MTTKASSSRDVVLYDAKKLRRDEVTVQRGFWRKFKRVVGKIPFSRELLAAYFAAMDASTPTYVRAVLMAALAYFVLPIDVIPDFILAFGFSDDAAVLATAISTVRGHIKPKHDEQAVTWIKGN